LVSLARFSDHQGNGIIAKQLIEIAKAGERNPDLLGEGALEKLREHFTGAASPGSSARRCAARGIWVGSESQAFCVYFALAARSL
jgi:hypothetical protein